MDLKFKSFRDPLPWLSKDLILLFLDSFLLGLGGHHEPPADTGWVIVSTSVSSPDPGFLTPAPLALVPVPSSHRPWDLPFAFLHGQNKAPGLRRGPTPHH